ncbi:MAG: hypothetical protein HPY75_03285 [Actinobacteria bacterium]|nr:hypothetical protein [Actinomycetota bacterium]
MGITASEAVEKLSNLDAQILLALYRFGALEIDQLRFALAHINGIERSRATIGDHLYRLQREDHGELIQGVMLSRHQRGSYPRSYFLSRGARPKKVMMALLGEPPCPAQWCIATELNGRLEGLSGTVWIDRTFMHERTIKNFHLCLAASRAGSVEWWRSGGAGGRIEFRCQERGAMRKRVAAPDAIFCWRSTDPSLGYEPLGCLLEVELSWAKSHEVSERLVRYAGLFRSGSWRDRLELGHFPTLLFLFERREGADTRTGLADMERHATVLRKTLARINPDMRSWAKVFRCGFTYADYFMGELDAADFTDPLAEPIWLDAFDLAGAKRHTLAEIVPESARASRETGTAGQRSTKAITGRQAEQQVSTAIAALSILPPAVMAKHNRLLERIRAELLGGKAVEDLDEKEQKLVSMAIKNMEAKRFLDSSHGPKLDHS